MLRSSVSPPITASEVTVERFLNPLREPCTVAAIAAIYRDVFRHDPWHEALFCPVCDTPYERHHKGRVCEACQPEHNILLVEGWPITQVVRDFYAEMQKPGAVCLLARGLEGIVGISWGYDVMMSEALGVHLCAPGLHERHPGAFFYMDEVALLQPYRGHGIGKKLVRALIDGQEPGRVLLRTLHMSPMHKLIEGLGGRAVQSISEGRIVMVV